MAKPAASDTATRILDIAERLVQTRGFNAFSYADVAAALKITKASLHYHFTTKAKLGEQLITRYSSRFLAALADLRTRHLRAPERLAGYVALYSDVLDDRRMCLCGMLAADFTTLPKPMRDGVRRFFEANELWLEGVLEDGRASGEIHVAGPPIEAAQLLVAALEGAMLLARSHNDASRFRSAATRLLADFRVASASQ